MISGRRGADPMRIGPRMLGPVLVCAAALLLGAGGCATAPKAPEPPAPPSVRRHHEVRTLRQHAWDGVKSLTRLYEPAPQDTLPGISGLAADIRAAQRRVERRGVVPDLDQLDAEQLVWRNPNFWRASLEIAPVDPTFPLLQALLLVSAGDLWQGAHLIDAALQAMPMHPDVRRVYLLYQDQLQQAIGASIPPPFWTARGKPPVEQLPLFAAALEASPDHAEILLSLLEAHRRVSANQAPRFDPAPYVVTLARVDPLRAALWREAPEERRAGEALAAAWKTFTDPYHTPDDRESATLIGALEAAGVERLALSLARLVPAARGFPTPADEAVWHRQLAHVLGPEATPLLNAWREGAVHTVAVGRLPEAADASAEPTGSASLPPVFAQWVERELSRTTLVIQSGTDNPDRQADAYLDRGMLHLYLGGHASAESDLNRAAVMSNPSYNPVLQLSRLRRVQGRFAEAESMILDAAQRGAPPELVAQNTAMLRFLESNWTAAATAFAQAYQHTPREPYFLLHGTAAALRAGKQPEREKLRSALASQPADAWPGKLLAHLAGDLPEADLLHAARQGNEQQILEQLCEAYFFLAHEALAAGDQALGVQRLRECLDTGALHFFEYELARAELKRLRPDEPERNRRPPPTPPEKREPGKRRERSSDPIDALAPA